MVVVVAGLDPAICAPPTAGRWPGQARPRRNGRVSPGVVWYYTASGYCPVEMIAQYHHPRSVTQIQGDERAGWWEVACLTRTRCMSANIRAITAA